MDHSGYFGRGDMQKEFEDAAFDLEKGAVSSIVSTASGLHLIQRYNPDKCAPLTVVSAS